MRAKFISLCSLVVMAFTTESIFAADAAPESQSIPIAPVKKDKPVDFMADVLPIFKKNCLACHNASDAKGDLVLESPQKILKGGEDGPAVVPGKGAESMLIKVASRQQKPYMPPKNNKSGATLLTPEELGLLKLWIDQGATGTVTFALGPVHWQPLPPALIGITALSVSPDGQYAAASRGNQIFIYNLASGQLETRLTDPELIKSGFAKSPGVADRDIIQSLAFSPDSRTLASGAYRSLKLWQRGAPRASTEIPFAAAGEVKAVAASSDGKFMVTGGADGVVKLWDLANSKLLHDFRGHTAPITCVAISPDSSIIAAGSSDKSAFLWDAKNPNNSTRLEIPAEILSLTFSISGNQLITGSSDGLIRVWNSALISNPTLAEIPPVITSFDTSGTAIALANGEGEVSLFDSTSGKFVKKLASGSPVSQLRFLSTNLLTFGGDKSLQLWNTAEAKKIAQTNMPIAAAATGVDEKNHKLVLAGAEGGIQVIDLSSNTFAPVKLFAQDLKNPVALVYSPNGALLFAATSDSRIIAYKSADYAQAFVIANGTPVRSLSVSPDGKLLAAAGEDKQVKIWNAETGAAHARPILSGFTAPVQDVTFSADSKKLLAGSAAGEVFQFDLASGQIEQSFNDARGMIHTVRYIAPGKLVSFASLNSVSFSSAALIKTIAGHGQAVTALSLGPSTNQLTSASKDGSVRIWNLEKGQQIRSMDHGGELFSVAVRKDGKRIASSGANKNIKLWNAENGQLIAEIKGDFEDQQLVRKKQADLNFARSEAGYRKTAFETAEKQEKTEAEAVKKATEQKEKTQKAFAEKVDAQKKAADAKAAAAKAVSELAATVKSAKEKKPELEKARKESADLAKQLTEKFTQFKAASDKATVEKNNAFKAMLDAAFQAKLASYQAAEAKSNADKEPANAALNETLKTAQKLASDKTAAAEALLDKVAAIKPVFDKATAEFAATEKAFKEAQEKAKAADSAFAANEKIVSESDKTTKDFAEKLKAAEKAFADADQALKTAEGAKNGAIQNLEGTIAGHKKTADEIVRSKQQKESADQDVKQSETELEALKKQVAERERPWVALAFAPDGATLAGASENGAVFVYSTESAKPLEKIAAHKTRINGLAFLPDSRLISGGADHAAKVWSLAPKWTLSRVLGDGSEKSPFIDRVLALAFSPDGQFLATGGGFPSRSGEIQIWKIADGSLLKDFKDPHSDTVYALQFSPDQKYLASGGADKFLRVFELASGKQVRAFEGHTHHVLGVAWERHGRTLASSGADKVIKIWDFASGEQRKTIEGFGKEVTSIRFIDGTNEALVSSGDAQVKFIRDDGGNVRSFGGSADYVEAASMTPDGAIIAAGGLDGILRVWNGSDAKLLNTFEPPKVEPGQLAGK